MATIAATPRPATVQSFVMRLFGVGVVIFLANAGLLVLQLVAPRLLAPFLGSSLETWTCIIGSFLAGIAAGNAVGGRIADARPNTWKLALYLGLGAIGAVWMIAMPQLLESTGIHKYLPLGLRIPVLAAVLCFPVALVLSMLTPLAIRLGVPNVGSTGGVAGLIFALSTLGCLLGNYLTGFYLIPHLFINDIVLAVAGLFLATAVGVLVLFQGGSPPTTTSSDNQPEHTKSVEAAPVRAVLPMQFACTIVFLCSFAGMTLELVSFRLMAQILGVSLYTWTGIIGVMLAGTALGNFLGGRVADWAGKKSRQFSVDWLATSMILSGLLCVLSLVLFSLVVRYSLFMEMGLINRILATTFMLFFLPMFFLGTISPQVIRLAVSNLAEAGRVAGRVYAYSTLGAIAGTFASGYFLISTIGTVYTLLLCAILPLAGLLLIRAVFNNAVLRYGTSIAMGAVVGGIILQSYADGGSVRETNYYTIRVTSVRKMVPSTLTAEWEPLAAVAGPVAANDIHHFRELVLDHLIHSVVDLDDPDHLHYRHEQIQVEMVYRVAAAKPEEQRVLVIGGGGYTFPRSVRGRVPSAQVDVVEIDPGVTEVAYSQLGLDKKLGITPYHMDGRQFVAEKAKPGSYDLVTLDAVNDYSVPSHLMTREFNEAVKKCLTPDGVYLVTVIDLVSHGKLWKAAIHTLRESYAHVALLFPENSFNEEHPELMGRSIMVIYASNSPLDDAALNKIMLQATRQASRSTIVPSEIVNKLLADGKKLILTDQFAPVDYLMADVFKDRNK